MNGATRKVTLCADDFAQSEQITSGILELISSRRLTATSVMSEAPHWPAAARRLMPLQSLADVGLHLNLTHSFETGGPIRPLSYWLLLSQLRLISRDWLRKLFCTQIDHFTEHLGRLPDFIDGHQHVHAFPLIRAALTDAIADRWPEGDAGPWLRAPDHLMKARETPIKAMVLRSACSGFSEHAAAHGLRVTPYFGGVYSLLPGANFPARMKQWLRNAPHGTLFMCHPGRATVDHRDPLDGVRALEYNYLASPAFAQDCREAGVMLGRFDAGKKIRPIVKSA